jgi:NitT/TauT family transport system permease protein
MATDGLRASVPASLGILLALWALGAWAVDDPLRLPSPFAVAAILVEEAASGRLWRHLAATFARVGVAFVLAMALGTAIGLALGRMQRVDRWLDPWLLTLLNVPALVLVVLCYLWIGLNEVAAITAVVLNKVAMVAVSVRAGARAMDPALDEMGRIFRLGFRARLVHLWLPQLSPYLAGAARNGLAIIWKIVLVAEFLGRSDGVGFQIHLYFQLFRIPEVIAYALAFMVAVMVLDYMILKRWEQSAFRWRDRSGR